MTSAFDLEAEVRDLAARRDIHDAVCRYMRGLDRLDPVLQRSAFHDDAWIDAGTVKGDANGFVEQAQALLATMEGTHHMLGQVRIEVDGDTARGECYFQAWHDTRDEAGNSRDLFVSGRYVDEYACRNGEWRIVRRALITDWVCDNPAHRAFFAAGPELIRAGRRGQDFSDTRNWPAREE
ncbi:hypothetical protein BSL82_07575 [Tardibacter chloracetimidivorans]|uniref:SnoaL-like domain-containing protein n=1 Tax=Tardibacter chloracetimidivorans TaxID=1921510 RepID=A0A1L3ZU65_9SPHN|nr:nuclear transport factor 2 family protein [Tardibacter chloracetimidivorans]API59182.1 hypothetical protein BSL82_07575 [Tardibacter chloracetimidivorans]